MDPATLRYANSSETAYGWHVSRGLQHIGNVANGLSCDCICLACGHALVASQGQINAWHFKHKARADCLGGTILLRAARIMLLEAAKRGEAIGQPAPQPIETWRPSESFLTMHGGRELDATRHAARARLETERGAIDVAIVNRAQHHRDKADNAESDAGAVLEIDISSLSALTQPEALHEAVLRTEVRRWAAQPPWQPAAARLPPEGIAQRETTQEATTAVPENYQEILKTVLAWFKTPGGRADSRINWPSGNLSGRHPKAGGKVWLRSVAITTLQPNGSVYRTSGQIVDDDGNLVPADVMFAFEGDSAIRRAKPGTLIIHCPRSVNDHDWPAQLNIIWRPSRTRRAFAR